MSLDKEKIEGFYPEAYMIEAMKVWKLPSGKEAMLSKMCESGDYFLEEKVDGYWYEFERTENHSYLFSRNTSVTTGCLSEKSDNVPHIIDALSVLPLKTIIIGEIYVPGGTSKDVTRIMGCLPAEAVKRQKDNPIHYYLHDIIMYDGINLMETGAEDRYKILEAIWNKYNLSQYDFLRLAVKVDEDLEAEISRILANGGEGAVLKKRDYPYTPGKRPAWSTIKIKQMDSIDLVCIGLCPPTKEYTGKELNTWEYWEEELNNEELYHGRYLDDEGNATIKTPMKPVTKYYYYGWPSAIQIGAYNDDGELKLLGTVSSGLSDEDKQGMAERPDDYIGKVVSLDCMSIDKREQTLRHPAFKAWRDDKDAKDCLISEVFK